MEQKTQVDHDRDLLEIVRGLLLAEAAFQHIHQKYKAGRLRFKDIGIWVDDKGQSLLYSLKEKCHSIYRYKGKRPAQKDQRLLDLVIGSIFHEAMKLREDLYQVEVYRPKYLQYKKRIGKSSYEKDYSQQFQRIILKAKQGVTEGMEETRSLFHDAIAQLIDLFKKNCRNTFLVRFLIENIPLLQKVYGTKKVNEIFNVMFDKGLLDAYRIAGQSYLQGEHYALAVRYFSKALTFDPKNRELRFLQNVSLGMNEYYKNADIKALAYFSKLIPLKKRTKLKKDYLKRVEEVCRKIAADLNEEDNLTASQEAGSLAGRIKTCYDNQQEK